MTTREFREFNIHFKEKKYNHVHTDFIENYLTIKSKCPLKAKIKKRSSYIKENTIDTQKVINIDMKYSIRDNHKTHVYEICLSDPNEEKIFQQFEHQTPKYLNYVVYGKTFELYEETLKKLGVLDEIITYDKSDAPVMYNIGGTLLYYLCLKFIQDNNNQYQIKLEPNGCIKKVSYNICMLNYTKEQLQEEYVKYREYIWLRVNNKIELILEEEKPQSDYDKDYTDVEDINDEVINNDKLLCKAEIKEQYPTILRCDISKCPYEVSSDTNKKRKA